MKRIYIFITIFLFTISCSEKSVTKKALINKLSTNNEKHISEMFEMLANPSDDCRTTILDIFKKKPLGCQEDADCEIYSYTDCKFREAFNSEEFEKNKNNIKTSVHLSNAFCDKCIYHIQRTLSIPVCKDNKCKVADKRYYCNQLSKIKKFSQNDPIIYSLLMHGTVSCIIEQLDNDTSIETGELKNMKIGEVAFNTLITMSDFDPIDFLPKECLENQTTNTGMETYFECVRLPGKWELRSQVIKKKWQSLQEKATFF